MRTARTSTLLATAAALICAAGGAAHAEERAVMTRDRTALRERPGEASDTVARAGKREKLIVLGEKGRWLKVKYRGRVGWVTRTQVEARDGAKGERTARDDRKGGRGERTKSGFGGGGMSDPMRVQVSAKRVRAFDDPQRKDVAVFESIEDDTLELLGSGDDGWILVENSTGAVGWIPQAAVRDWGKFSGDPRVAPTGKTASAAQVAASIKAGKATKAPAGEPDGDDDDEGDDEGDTEVAAADEADADADADEGDSDSDSDSDDGASSEGAAVADTAAAPAPGMMSRFAMTASATAGLDIFGMTMNGADGSSALVTATSPSMGVSAGGSYRINPKLRAGAAVDFTMASGGDMQYQTAEATTGGTSFQRNDIRARAEVAWGPSWTVAARAGYLYSNLSVESDSTETLMTGEEIAGLTVGVGGTMPVGQKMAVAAALDILPAGVERPAERPASGLYGDSSKAAWLSAGFMYQLPYRLAATATYRFGYGSTSFTDGAATDPVTASRDDQYHTVMAGLGFHL